MSTATPPARGRLIGISDVADQLGVDVRHVRRLVYEKRIPYIKWGHLLRFDPAEIAAWIDNPPQPPIDEMILRRINRGEPSGSSGVENYVSAASFAACHVVSNVPKFVGL